MYAYHAAFHQGNRKPQRDMSSGVKSLPCVFTGNSHHYESDSLRPHGLQHIRVPCPSLFTGVCSKSCSLSGWCHPAISSSVVPFSSCLQSFLASGSFPMSQFFTLGGQSIGASASGSVLPMNIQSWFPLRLTGLISLLSKGLWRVFSSTIVQKHQFSSILLTIIQGRIKA